MTTDVLLARKRENWQDMNKICKDGLGIIEFL